MDTPYTHPSMPTDEFPRHVTRSPFSPFLRPLPEDIDLKPVPWSGDINFKPISWSDPEAMPITVTPKEPLEPYYDMVQLETPTYFERTFAESLALAEAQRKEELESWLEGVVADPVGRKLVQDIIERVEARQKQQFLEALATGVAKPVNVIGVDLAKDGGCYVTARVEDGMVHLIEQGTIRGISIDSDGMGSIVLGGEED